MVTALLVSHLLLSSSSFAGEAAQLAGPDRGDLPSAPSANAGDQNAPDAIINGQDATKEDWPMTGVSLFIGNAQVGNNAFDFQNFMCSSTLIAPDVVLIAAHCVDVEDYMLLLSYQLGQQVRLNSSEMYWTRRLDVSPYQFGAPPRDLPDDAVKVRSYVLHEEWVGLLAVQTGVAKNNDIALIFLDEPILDIPLGYLPDLTVAETLDETALALDEEVVIVGWGQQAQDALPGTYGFKKMATSHISEIGPKEVKVGQIASDARKCHGDSGGPTFKDFPETESTESWRVIGVTSHAYDLSDCNSTGGVDTRVSGYLDWIDAQMTAACADGTRAWCEIPGIIPPPTPEGYLAWEIPEEDADTKKGCGCDASGSTLSGWMALGLLALVRRRRA